MSLVHKVYWTVSTSTVLTHYEANVNAHATENDRQLAASLSATARQLERNIVQNHVLHLLETRPDKEELVTHNIMDGLSSLISFGG